MVKLSCFFCTSYTFPIHLPDSHVPHQKPNQMRILIRTRRDSHSIWDQCANIMRSIHFPASRKVRGVGLLGLGASILYAIMASVGGAKAICAANFPNRPGDCIRTCICGLPKWFVGLQVRAGPCRTYRMHPLGVVKLRTKCSMAETCPTIKSSQSAVRPKRRAIDRQSGPLKWPRDRKL